MSEFQMEGFFGADAIESPAIEAVAAFGVCKLV